MVVATVGMIITVSGAAATVGHMLMESRIRQIEIRDEFLSRMCDENHEAMRSHLAK